MMGPGRALAKVGVTPNLLTGFGFLLSVVSGWMYFERNLPAGATLLVSMGIVDMLDGAVARASDHPSRFGSVLDHVVDRYAELFIVVGITLGGFVEPVWGFFALFGMVMASYTRARAESAGQLQSVTVGIAERQEKLLLIVAGSLASLFILEGMLVAVILVGILSHVTVIQRLHYAWVHTRGT
jgi:CDP-diacylglycerol--glycerol-3-phosphate 3-phosphatidyltransferase/archaetidylinositol phosphate synthase